MTADRRPDRDPPQRGLIESQADLGTALLLLATRARHQLRIESADLSVFALGDPDLCAALRALLLGASGSRVLLLADDLQWIDTRAPRLRALQRQFSHALLLRHANRDDPVADSMVVIGDDVDAIRLRPGPAVNGDLWCNNAPFVQPLAAAFDRRWQHAVHNQPVVPLGL